MRKYFVFLKITFYKFLFFNIVFFSGSIFADRLSSGLLIQTVKKEKVEDGVFFDENYSLYKGESNSEDVRQDNKELFYIKRLDLVGNKLLADSLIYNSIKVKEYSSLEDIYEYSRVVETVYKRNGYPLVRVVVPEQDITDGILQLNVIEAVLSNVEIASDGFLVDGYFHKYFNRTMIGQVVKKTELERSILLLSDIPGVNVQATFVPGDRNGTTELHFLTNELKKIEGQVSISNFGSDQLNRARVSSNININNPFDTLGSLEWSGITSGNKFDFNALEYNVILNDPGFSLNVVATNLNYFIEDGLGRPFIGGDANSYGLSLAYSVIRSKRGSLFASVGFNSSSLK